jgi:hypothetical protein
LAGKSNQITPRRRQNQWLRRLRDIRGIRRELARCYGEAREGALSWQDAARAASVLQILGRMIEGSDFEERLAALEGAIAERDAMPVRGNGHAGAYHAPR